MNADARTLVSALRARTRASVFTDLETRLATARDASPGLHTRSDEEMTAVAPVAVVRPRSAADVQELVKIAESLGAALVPYGAGSNVVGGLTSSRPFVALDLAHLNAVVEVSAENLTVTVEAGARAQAVEQRLNDSGLTLGHYPQSLPLATIGGLIATRSSGTFSTHYGNIEDTVLSLDVVWGRGRLARVGRSPRTIGPGLAGLFVGSEGALGIITRATLRISPVPSQRAFDTYVFSDVSAGLRVVRSFYQREVEPAVVRLYDGAEAATLGVTGGKALLLLGFQGEPEIVEAQRRLTGAIILGQGGEEFGPDIGERWYAQRFNASWLAEGNRENKIADAIDVGAPWSSIEAVYDGVTAALAPHTDRLWAHFSHFYPQGGSIYFIVFLSGASREDARERHRVAWEAAMEATLRAGGAIAHHHGIGAVRLPWLAQELGTASDMLRSIKTALDPHDIFAPGRLGL